MKKFAKGIITALVMLALIVGVSGCAKEGPLEKAGKQVDKTAEKAGEQIEKAGQNVQDAAK